MQTNAPSNSESVPANLTLWWDGTSAGGSNGWVDWGACFHYGARLLGLLGLLCCVVLCWQHLRAKKRCQRCQRRQRVRIHVGTPQTVTAINAAAVDGGTLQTVIAYNVAAVDEGPVVPACSLSALSGDDVDGGGDASMQEATIVRTPSGKPLLAAQVLESV
eukprot:COSAG01_NODE_5828_length_4007_cov_15.721597_5_plen_161_part_00